MLMSPVIGHRGAMGYASENTAPSFEKAAQLGCTWVETDATLLADGTVVLFHDDQLDRLCQTRGLICEKTWSEVCALRVGEAKIPSLEEGLNLCRRLKLGVNIELKVHGDEGVALARAVKQILTNHTKMDLLISSFDLCALDAFDLALPKALIADQLPIDWREITCQSVHLNAKYIDKDQARAVKAVGLDLYAFTVNDNNLAQKLYTMGVDGVFTNYPDQIKQPL